MSDMKSALMGPNYYTPNEEPNLGKYFSIFGEGSGSPMRDIGTEGLRKGDWNIGGKAEARIPLDPILKDALLRLSAGGYAFGGNVDFPQEWQDRGAPPGVNWGDSVINNLGVGFFQDGFSTDWGYNPETGENRFGVNKLWMFP